MGVGKTGSSRDTEGNGQLMEPKTLDQIGEDLRLASQTLSWKERLDMAATLLENLRKPVGKLGRKK